MDLIKSTIKTTVSADRNRYKVQLQTRTYDLDLTYITTNILAMAIPGKGVESFWRNHIDDVGALLKAKHTTSFLIWNLSERSYDYTKFDNQIVDFPFPDHHPPPLSMFAEIISSLDSWLRADKTHVAVVHCKGGKGRTGTIIVAYLLFSGLFDTLPEAQERFAMRRSEQGKGVTQPSQKRYLQYFDEIVVAKKVLTQKQSILQNVVLHNPPKLSEKDYMVVEFYDFSKPPEPKILTAVHFQGTKSSTIESSTSVLCSADILVRFLLPEKSKKPLFHVVFHIDFILDTVIFGRNELDSVDKKL